MTLNHLTGIVLIVLPIAFNLLFFGLARAFEYPEILREPADVILKRFADGGPRLVALWYAFALTALLAIPMALLLQQVFAVQQPALAAASAILGALSGLVQAMGLLRWPLLVPALAAQYNASGTTAEQRQALAVVFNAFHQYVGVVIGEQLGYLFTGAWTIVVGLMMFGSPLFHPLLGLFGIVSAMGVLSGLAEPFGWKPAGVLNAISYLLWSLWLVSAGVMLLLV
jgi:hypothetical protein